MQFLGDKLYFMSYGIVTSVDALKVLLGAATLLSMSIVTRERREEERTFLSLPIIRHDGVYLSFFANFACHILRIIFSP